MNRPLLTAHSGCEGTRRDSMESVQAAIKLASDVVEVDVRMAPDGVLRIAHDPVVSTEKCGSYLTLNDVFDLLYPTTLRINCDLKERGYIHALLKLAKTHKFDRERLIISGALSPMQIADDPKILDLATIYLNVEEILHFHYLRSADFKVAEYSTMVRQANSFVYSRLTDFDAVLPTIVEWAHHLGVKAINFPYRILDQRHYSAFEEAGIAISIWTVDDLKALEKILGYNLSNLENVTTNKVGKAKQIFAAFYEHRSEGEP